MQLEPLPYHVAVAEHLERYEPDLWTWFRSNGLAEKYKAQTGQDLLRSAIRLERKGPNGRRYMLAEQARDSLGLSAPVTLYQMQDAGGVPNAFLFFTQGEIIVAFAGRILELLDTDAELLDLLGHEISHYKLFVEAQGRFHTADRLLLWLIQRENCPAEFAETWRRNRLFTEIYCDIGGLITSGDRDATIRGLVKSLADFKDADAVSYLKQVAELMAAGPGASRGTTHPELHVRALAVAEAQTTPPAEFHTKLNSLICGSIELGTLDLIDQKQLAALTRRVLDRVLGDATARSEEALAQARQLFNDYTPPAGAPQPLTSVASAFSASVTDYIVYLLLDLATTDGSGSRASMAAVVAAADELGLGVRFREVARQELRGRRGLLAGLATKAA